MSLLSSNPTIAAKIDELWNKFWSGGISNPLTAIEQITYLLFMKKLDENDLKAQADAEFTGRAFKSRFEGTYVPRTGRFDEWRQGEAMMSGQNLADEYGIDKQLLRWGRFKRLPAEQMLDHIQRYVFPFLKELDGNESPFARHMANAVFIIPKPSLLVEAVKTIDEIYELIEQDAAEKGQDFQDIQGDVYEMLLSEIASAGKNGQFRTPRHIIKLLVELVDPQPGHRIADPACGTGGFLLGAYQYMITGTVPPKELKKVKPDEDGFVRSMRSPKLSQEVKDQLGEKLQGYDVDPTMVRMGLMNLMMHGIESPQIDYKDTLSKSYKEQAQYDVVLANPPFTGNIDKSDIHEDLDLGTTKSELLFIQRIYQLLRNGGTAGVIVPQGVLFGTGKAFVAARKLMVDKSELKAVVALPSGVFKPYAGVSTALLIFTKGSETEQVWFYNMESDGYSLDDKRNKLKTADGSDDYGDLQEIVTLYQSRDPKKDSDRTAKHFFVPKQEVAEQEYDLSYARYKEEVYEEIAYEAPDVILEKLIGEDGLEQQIVKGLEELKGMIS